MIHKEFKDLVFEFVKLVSDFDTVLSVILYGSVAKGTADKRSDIDFIVIFDTPKDVGKMREKGMISQIALDLEKKYDKNIQIVFTNKKFDRLDNYFVEQVFREGIILFGKVPQVDVKKLRLEPYSIIHYSLKNLSHQDKMRVKRALYGSKTVRKYKRKTYTSIKKGLVEELNADRIGIASILVSKKKSGLIKEVLDRFNAKYKEVEVWLSKV